LRFALETPEEGQQGYLIWKDDRMRKHSVGSIGKWSGKGRAAKERKLAAHRESLHGRLVHEIVAVGNTIILEKISYKTCGHCFKKPLWQRWHWVSAA